MRQCFLDLLTIAFSKHSRYFRPIFLHFWQICPNEMSYFFENGSLSKRFKQGNFEPHNSLKRYFTNIRGLRSNFVECESFLESNCPDILALCETNLDDSIDSGNFSVRGYLPLVRKDSSTHMYGLEVYVKEGLPFTWNLSLENSADSYFCFRLVFLLLFPLSITFFVVMHGF